MSRLVVLTGFCIFLFSCQSSEKYPAFEKDPCGLAFKYIEKGKNTEKLAIGDYIEMELTYKSETDSILFSTKELNAPFRMRLSDITHLGGSFENALLLMSPGDKMAFVVKADSFYNKTIGQELPSGVQPGSDVLFELKLLKKLNNQEVFAEREQYMQQLKERENTDILNFVEDNQINVKPTASGLYIVKKNHGNGTMAKPGKILTVHYTGKFIDGRIFDSSYKRNETFDFELGVKQVIDAWEEACMTMHEGDKIMIITPSILAYGNEGFGNLIPPYSPLIFDIELIAVN